ncbi:hypothetical protein CALCODRAFT_251169 [Calocera cornea HHB12733]|uniref:Uncharacterized protein n=1 Tax=Calocera cornea HHB12733 TaxID=1353952 RepID=A0A165JWV8_9BASI|nr:hypothetical protein CALCODRAFT_251169 [Calocera cornea HHB12733]
MHVRCGADSPSMPRLTHPHACIHTLTSSSPHPHPLQKAANQELPAFPRAPNVRTLITPPGPVCQLSTPSANPRRGSSSSGTLLTCGCIAEQPEHAARKFFAPPSPGPFVTHYHCTLHTAADAAAAPVSSSASHYSALHSFQRVLSAQNKPEPSQPGRAQTLLPHRPPVLHAYCM